jgi:hypothetical protein
MVRHSIAFRRRIVISDVIGVRAVATPVQAIPHQDGSR